jgi:hypothetical protein
MNQISPKDYMTINKFKFDNQLILLAELLFDFKLL